MATKKVFGYASTAAEVAADIDLSGKVAIVTGGYSGMWILLFYPLLYLFSFSHQPTQLSPLSPLSSLSSLTLVSGIGKETARVLATRGARVFVIGRDMIKCEQEVDDLRRDTGMQSILFCFPSPLFSPSLSLFLPPWSAFLCLFIFVDFVNISQQCRWTYLLWLLYITLLTSIPFLFTVFLHPHFLFSSPHP